MTETDLKLNQLKTRLGSIEIQSRSSLDRSHFVARSRSRPIIFVCWVYKRYFLLILTTLRVCQATPRLYRSRCRQVKISVSGTTLIKKLNNHRPYRLQGHRLEWKSGYSDSFLVPKRIYYYSESHRIDKELAMTLFWFPSTVTITDEACITIIKLFIINYSHYLLLCLPSGQGKMVTISNNCHKVIGSLCVRQKIEGQN